MTEPEHIAHSMPEDDYPHMAALDLGSNSFHLVVTRVVSGNVQIVHRIKRRVRLADGLDEDNFLSQEAIERGLDGLKVMRDSLQGFSPEQVRIVATYTLRKAINAREFIVQANHILPYPIEIISGIEEARLIYAGVSHTQHLQGKNLVIDIGGGSTEFIIGDGFDPIVCRSLQMGCVSFTKRFFNDGKINKSRFNKAVSAAQQVLELIAARYVETGWNACLGSSGTVKSILQQIGLDEQKEVHEITLPALYQLRDDAVNSGHCNALSVALHNPERAPVFAAGIAILIASFKSLGITSMTFSSSALREGVLYEMQTDLKHTKTRERTVHGLTQQYNIDTAQAKRVMHSAYDLFDQCYPTQNQEELRSMLGFACLLHEVGIAINSRGFHRHSAYIIDNADIPGFNLEETRLISLLLRSSRKKMKPEWFTDFIQFAKSDILVLIVIIRLSVLFNIKRQDGILPAISVTLHHQQVHLKVGDGWLDDKPVFSGYFEKEANLIKAIGLDLIVE